MAKSKFADITLPLKYKIIIIATYAIIILLWSFLQPPRRYGDGLEYISMTVSIANHFTPELKEQDRIESQKIAEMNNDKLNPDFPGYFQDVNGRYYSFHFWAYSLLCVPIYWILKLLNANTLSMFQILNAILLIVALYWTLFVSKIDERVRVWFVFGLIFNPILLYVHYTHPEVYSFVFLYIALLCWLDDKRVLACALAAIASWQNPGIAVVPAYFGLMELVRVIKAKQITKSFIFASICCSMVLVPYLWTYWKYKKFSIIGNISTTGISLEKSFSLLFDLNMGLFVYLPVHFIILFWLIFKRNKTALTFTLLLFVIALVNSTQLNWNSGMSYINRYAVWMIPIVLVGCYPYLSEDKNKFKIPSLVIISLTTGAIIMYCIGTYKQFNFITFTNFSKIVMAKAPALYNPPAEIFIERSKGIEVNPNEAFNYLPLALAAEDGIKKILVFEDGEYQYYNESVSLASSSIAYIVTKPQESIFKTEALQQYDSGWRGLEKSNDYFRWTTMKANLSFSLGIMKGVKNVSMDIASFEVDRICEIKINNTVVFKGMIPTDYTKITVTADMQPINNMTITSTSEDIKSNTPESIRFNIKNIEIY